jgi:hypothetical protein
MRFYLRDLWTRNAEMVSAALMSGDGTKTKGVEATSTTTSGSASQVERTWGKARLGQSVILVEVIASIREAREMVRVARSLFWLEFPIRLNRECFH